MKRVALAFVIALAPLTAPGAARAGLFGRDKVSSVWSAKPQRVDGDDSDWEASSAFESDGFSVLAMNDDKDLYVLVSAHTREAREQLTGEASADLALWFLTADGRAREWGAQLPFSRRAALTAAMRDPAGADPAPEYVFYQGAAISTGDWPAALPTRLAMSARRPVWELKVPLERLKRGPEGTVLFDFSAGASHAAPRPAPEKSEDAAPRRTRKHGDNYDAGDSGPAQAVVFSMTVRLAPDPARPNGTH